jgi:hypothetical protein
MLRAADLERFDRRATTWFLRLFGAALVVNVLTELRAGVWSVHAGRLYPWRHVPLVPLYPPAVLALEWLATLAVATLLALGIAVRVASRLAALVTFVALLERYSNHGALLFIVAAFVALDPPNPKAPAFEETPLHNLGLCRAELAIVYVASALNKVLHGFGSGDVIAFLTRIPPSIARPLAIAVIVVELALPFVLVRFPRVGIAAVVCFHAGICSMMPGLWSFALVMLSLAVLYVPPRRRADHVTAAT